MSSIIAKIGRRLVPYRKAIKLLPMLRYNCVICGPKPAKDFPAYHRSLCRECINRREREKRVAIQKGQTQMKVISEMGEEIESNGKKYQVDHEPQTKKHVTSKYIKVSSEEARSLPFKRCTYYKWRHEHKYPEIFAKVGGTLFINIEEHDKLFVPQNKQNHNECD